MAVVVATPVTMVTPEASASPTPNTADASLPPALRNYPGVTRIEHHDGKIRVEVSQSFAESLDDLRHEQWLSGLFGQCDAVGLPVTGIWEEVRTAPGKLEPLEKWLSHPVLPTHLRGAGSMTPRGASQVKHYPLPLPYGGGLVGKTIVLSPGHGIMLSNGTWGFQRGTEKFEGCAECRGLREDLFTSELTHRYLIPMLIRAGARVYTPREWDPRVDEIIVDDSGPGYQEQGSGWENGTSPGGHKGGYRVLAPGAAGSASFIPDLPNEGNYWISLRYVAGSNRSTATRVVIEHAGGSQEMVIDQRQDNSRWIYLGQFWMRPGANHGVRLEPTAGDPGYVIADAVRFGGGIHAETSAPRWHMSAQAHLAYLGAPSSITSSGNDVTMRPLYAEWQGADVYLSIHSNATGSVNTTSGTSTYRYNCGTYSDHSTAPSPSACDDPPRSDALQRAVHDGVIQMLREHWDPNWRDFGRRVANFGEVRALDQIPGALIELAFHDNTVTPSGSNPPRMPDNRALQEPRWRRLTARGLYKGLLEFLNPGAKMAPEAPVITSAVTEPAASGVGVRVRWEPVKDAKGYRVYVARGGKGFDGSTIVDSTDVLLDAAPGQPVFVRVSALNEGGESLASEVLGAASQSGLADHKQVLIVQGFDREDAWTAEGGNTFDYVFAHGLAIAAAGWGFHSATNEAVADGAIPLEPYTIVDWMLGEESVADATLDATERDKVEAYTKAGGKLLVSGAEIGWDLVNTGKHEAFVQNVFGAAFEKDDSENDSLVAPSAGVLGSLPEMHLDDGTQGTYPVEYPDVFLPSATGASQALTYGNGDGAAVAYDNGETRTFLAGFPLETVQPVAARDALMASILSFLVPEGPPEPMIPDAGVEDDAQTEPQEEAGTTADSGKKDAAVDEGGVEVTMPPWSHDDSADGCACRASGMGSPHSAAWLWVGLGLLAAMMRNNRMRRA